MTPDGYPDDKEIEAIEKWDYMDALSLIGFIEERWQYKDWGFKKKWAKDSFQKKDWVLHIEMHTGGWSGNEDLINALLRNRMATVILNYRMWKAGGHYWFEFDPRRLGYKKVSEYCKEKKCSRQNVHKQKEKFHWIDAGGKIKMVKPINEIKTP